MGRGMLCLGALMLTLLFPSMVAFAQTPLPDFELERLELNPGAEGSLVVGMGELLQPGQFRVSAVSHYSHRLLLLRQDGKDYELVSGRATMHLAAAYAFTSWMQMGAQLPLVVMQQGGDVSGQDFASPGSSFGAGTPTVSVRLGLLTQTEQGGLDVALEGNLGLPVGSRGLLGRDPGMRYMPRVMVGRRFGFIRASLDAGFMVRPAGRIINDPDLPQDELGNELRIGAALVTTGRRLRWEFNVRGTVQMSKQPGAAELLPGVRYLVNPSLEVFALAGMGVGAAPGTPLFRVLAGGSFGNVMPRRGPGESSINCEPGLAHTVEECPDMDEDSDGVRNNVDQCPLVPGTPERKGCPPRDTDGDGLEDMLDGCPTEPGPAARQGCPVRDQDEDGVEDEVDSCPVERGPVDNRGCPLKDRDNDGIDNDQDLCPDAHGLPQRQGCPEDDSDKDGVPNRLDSCAREPGLESNQGCPAHEEPLVVITPEELELRGKVFFEMAQARIQPRSFALLDWVAKVLREHPELPRVVVGGHTDDRGFADQLRQLSRQRAEAVLRYLIDKGVPAERIEARGYGPDRPIDSNATSIGRENNRRVDFQLIRAADE